MEVVKSLASDLGSLQNNMGSVLPQPLVFETIVAARRTLACLLMMARFLLKEDTDTLPKLIGNDQRFPFAELYRRDKTELEAKDGSDTENDEEDDEDAEEPEDDDAGDEDFSGEGEDGDDDDEEGDPDEDLEANGNQGSDDDDDGYDDNDEQDNDDDEEEEEEKKTTMMMRINHLLRRESEVK